MSTEADEVVIGPNDHLVLITREAMPWDELVRLREGVPEALRGRLLIVDGASMQAEVIRGDA